MQDPVKIEIWYFSEMFFSHVLTWNKRRRHRIISHIQSGCQADIVVREHAGRYNICLVDKVYLESEFGPKNCWGSSSSCFGNICSPNFSPRNQFYLSESCCEGFLKENKFWYRSFWCNIRLVDKVFLESEFGPKNCWGSYSSCFGNICSPNFSLRNQFYLSKMELL